jgi:hypothetical protein
MVYIKWEEVNRNSWIGVRVHNYTGTYVYHIEKKVISIEGRTGNIEVEYELRKINTNHVIATCKSFNNLCEYAVSYHTAAERKSKIDGVLSDN